MLSETSEVAISDVLLVRYSWLPETSCCCCRLLWPTSFVSVWCCVPMVACAVGGTCSSLGCCLPEGGAACQVPWCPWRPGKLRSHVTHATCLCCSTDSLSCELTCMCSWNEGSYREEWKPGFLVSLANPKLSHHLLEDPPGCRLLILCHTNPA